MRHKPLATLHALAHGGPPPAAAAAPSGPDARPGSRELKHLATWVMRQVAEW